MHPEERLAGPSPVLSGMSDHLHGFGTWLLRRVAQAVEAGDVPANLLAELKAELEASRARPRAQSHADAVRDIAVELQMPIEKVEAGLAALEGRPLVTRELLMRRLAEAWLERLRKGYRTSD